MTCPSPNISNPQIACGQPTIGDSHHCEYHAGVLRPHYLKYKAVPIDHILGLSYDELSTHAIEQLLKFISRVERVYRMRVEYRAKAFVPAYWDRQHHTYIEKCISTIYTIREILNIKFTICEATGVTSVNDPGDEVPDDSGDPTPQPIAVESLENINTICEEVATVEAEWGDSEAIRQYRLGASRLYVTLNVLKSMIGKLYPDVAEDQLYSMSLQVMIYLSASYRMYVLYRKSPAHINVAKFRCRINWVEGIFLYNHKVIAPIVADFIKKCAIDSNLLRGFVGACVNQYDEFVNKSTILRAQKVVEPFEGFQLRIQGAKHAYHIIETPTAFMWRFDYAV